MSIEKNMAGCLNHASFKHGLHKSGHNRKTFSHYFFGCIFKLILRKKPSLKNPRCIVVATGGNLGGAIISLPLLESICEHFSNSKIIIVTNTPVGEELVHFAQLGDEIYVIQSDSFRSLKGIYSYIKIFFKIKRSRPELLIMNYDCGIDKFLLLMGIPSRVGHVGTCAQNKKIPYEKYINIPVEMDDKMNWLETYRRLSQKVGANFSGYPSLSLSSDLISWATGRLRIEGVNEEDKLIAVQIGVWQAQSWKQWPIGKLINVCRYFYEKHQYKIICFGNVDGLKSFQEFSKYLPIGACIDFVGKTTIAEAAALLSQCHLSICNDSGLMHLSAAIETPVVAIYGMTDPQKTWCYPVDRHRIVRCQDCFPCYGDDFTLSTCSHRKCLAELSEETVIEAILDLIYAI